MAPGQTHTHTPREHMCASGQSQQVEEASQVETCLGSWTKSKQQQTLQRTGHRCSRRRRWTLAAAEGCHIHDCPVCRDGMKQTIRSCQGSHHRDHGPPLPRGLGVYAGETRTRDQRGHTHPLLHPTQSCVLTEKGSLTSRSSQLLLLALAGSASVVRLCSTQHTCHTHTHTTSSQRVPFMAAWTRSDGKSGVVGGGVVKRE